MASPPLRRACQATSCRSAASALTCLPPWPHGHTQPSAHHPLGARTVHRMCTAADLQEQGPAPELRPRPVKRIETQVKDIPVTSGASVLKQYLAPGKVVEFRVQDSYVLGLVTKQLPSKPGQKHVVTAVDVDGKEYTVQPSQVVVVLPGKDYTDEALQRIQAKVRSPPPCTAAGSRRATKRGRPVQVPVL